MKKLIQIVFVVVFTSGIAFGQQDPQWTQNVFNRASVNPAASGRDGNNTICGTLLFRDQNMGFEGNPNTFSFNVNGGFSLFGAQHGAGLTVISDQLGAISTTTAKVAYAYKLNLGDGQLGIGVNLGILSMAIDNAWIATDPYQEDPRIPDEATSNTAFDLGFGLYYENDKFFAGISSLHLVPGTITESGSKDVSFPSSVDWDQQFDITRHLYLTAGYKFEITPEIELRPSVFAKYDMAVPQFDVNVLAYYNEQFWGGLSYRYEDAVAVMVGLDFGAVSPSLDGLKLGLAYDITTSELSKYSSGTVEIFLRYCYHLTTKQKIQEVHSVRFL